ncbi:hypothetical protein [Bacterioplanoides sp.]|uniref:hypothetical protein n=1 Tax=Bacterioplanoides sp. TaxID=2066072 RepID=UPI003B59246F
MKHYLSGGRGLITLAISALSSAPALSLELFADPANEAQIEMYGRIAPASFFGTNKVYRSFDTKQSVIDDTRATLGVNGTVKQTFWKLELDYDRMNFPGGSGDMELQVDKAYVGHKFNENHSLSFGLMNSALDDVDRYGQTALETMVELQTAQDQDQSIKYEVSYGPVVAATSFSYKAESQSGEAFGDTWNGYIGVEYDIAGFRLGAENRTGSEGKSRFGKGRLYTIGARVTPIDNLIFKLNAYTLKTHLAQRKFLADGVTQVDLYTTDENRQDRLYRYNQFEENEWRGAEFGVTYNVNEQLTLSASWNFEERDEWDRNSKYWTGNQEQYDEWGDSREWQTLTLRYQLNSNTELAVEASPGEAAQNGYSRITVFF